MRKLHDRARPLRRWLHRQPLPWLCLALLLTVVGSAGAVLAASIQSQHDASKARQAFASSSVAVASTLQLAVQHELDLVVSASAFVADDPSASNAQFVHWVRSVSAFQRYPELLGLGHSVVVPASKLAAFAAVALRHPAGTLPAGGGFQVLPTGHRSFYCLSVGAASRSMSSSLPAGYDFCAGATGRASIATRDSGMGAYATIKSGKTTALSVLVPVYRGGLVPTTMAARRATFLGWIGMSVVPNILVDQALAGHPRIALTFRYHVGSESVSFHLGKAPPRAQSAMIDLHNGWTVRTFASGSATGILGTSGLLLLAGIALSALLSAFVYVLGTGRGRARRLVGLRTAELRHQALHDGLTGLPNRVLALDRAEQMLARGRRHQTPVAAMYVDVDGFKHVNDTFGHAAGDELLKTLADRLQSVVRDVDTAARLGGDEFIVLVEGSTLDAGPELVAERLIEVLRQPYDMNGEIGRQLSVTASVGIASGSAASADELLANADVALYEAKAAGGDRYTLFQSSMQSAANERLLLQMDLAEALEGDELFLLYQPTFDLRTQRVVGIEALLRWRHPTRGVVSPVDFIPVAEQSGLIIAIGRWVLTTACRQAATWYDRGHRIDMCVNVSGRQLDRDEMLDDVSRALADSRLHPAGLTLEVTETALMRDAEAAARRLMSLKQLGVQIAIDDFGTGYSSLAYLQQFPVDVLKIDRSFISGIDGSEKSAALVHTLVQLGKMLDLETLAEGIEDQAQLEALQREQCDRGQGFLFARPLDAEAAEDFLNAMLASPLAPG
jgi:diguanylate cyclase (GGDEF)-like protein